MNFLTTCNLVGYAYLGPRDKGQGTYLITGGNPPKEGDAVKLIKAIGLAGVAAMVAMAFVGVGTASATGLCSESPETVEVEGKALTKCKTGKAYTTGQEYKAEATNAILENEVENVTCTTSQTTLKQTEANTSPASVPLLGEVTALTFSGCKSSGGFNCTVQSLNKPYKASLSSETGLLTVTGKTGEPSASVSCGLGLLSCVFGNTTLGLTVESGNPAAVKAENVSMKMTKKEGFLKCPASSFWTATYVATNPTSIWISGM